VSTARRLCRDRARSPHSRASLVRRYATAAACLALALLAPAAARAARPLTLGFYDGAFTGPNAQLWLHRSVAAGAQIVRINIGWDAPNTATMPAGFNPRNPADPHYNFSQADQAIRLATEQGLRVLVTFTGAPRWAEGRGRPASAAPGSWRPNPLALEAYGAALAKRYSGRFPDPAHPGSMLPRVTAFQVWNEPNLSAYLTPQWSGHRATAPIMYRSMLNAFYRGVKSVDPKALVVTAGTAPFGDPAVGGQRIQPALFWRDVLCLRQSRTGKLSGTACPDPAHFDVLAHHPYAWGSPLQHALWPDDVAIPDLGKLTRILRAAERSGRALPRMHHPLWVTEIGYNTKPPNPSGLPLAKDALWVEETLAELWREGVSVITWNQVGDEPPQGGYSTTSQSGVYFVNGRPKPALTAFRFPLVAWRSKGHKLRVWGRAPAAGRVEIQLGAGTAFRTVRRIRVHAGSTFVATLPDPRRPRLRAQIGSQSSLVWQAG
jgi:hypothetical protein